MLEHVANVSPIPHEARNGIIAFKITRSNSSVPEADYARVGPTH